MAPEKRIKNYGSSFLNKLIETILEEATKPDPYDENIHEENKNKLKDKITEICDSASLKPISYDEFWFQAYSKIIYAGTRADKATNEIESIKEKEVFNDFRVLEEKSWDFNPQEWTSFVNYWKNKLNVRANWLQEAKKDETWNDVVKYHFKVTGTSSIMLMTKSGCYEGIKFSSLSPKMTKYITIARKLCELEKEKIDVMKYFTGADYNFETNNFWNIHKKFAELLGDITSLHLMMDLGFKTVKPDRVLTYLFYKLGWLDCLEPNLSKEQVLAQYMKKNVWIDVINKAILLDAIWEPKFKYSNSLRAIDLWIVKYGQEPEESFGLTKNLQNEISVETIFEAVMNRNGREK